MTGDLMTARERELLDDIITDFGNIVPVLTEIRQVIGTDNYDKRVKLFPIK